MSQSESDESSSSLSERTQTLNDLDESILNETASTSRDGAIFEEWSQNQKNKKQLRSSRIAEKEAEKKEIVDSIRDHKEEQSQNQKIKAIQNMMIMKMMQKTMNMLEGSGDEPPRENNNNLNARIDAIEDKIKVINNNIEYLCSQFKQSESK